LLNGTLGQWFFAQQSICTLPPGGLTRTERHFFRCEIAQTFHAPPSTPLHTPQQTSLTKAKDESRSPGNLFIKRELSQQQGQNGQSRAARRSGMLSIASPSSDSSSARLLRFSARSGLASTLRAARATLARLGPIDCGSNLLSAS
jgi:hypothetical protein